MRRHVFPPLVALSTFALGACNQQAVESWLAPDEAAASGPSLYSDEAFAHALDTIKKRVPAPIRALSLLVYPDHIVLQASDPSSRSKAVQYVYRDRSLSGPVPVKLLGTGKLEENVFVLDTAKVDAIPRLAREAKTRANIPEGAVARVLLRRNLPETADVQFRTFVTSQRRDAVFDADHAGKFIEPAPP